jgi:hypothetical protein
MVEAELAQSVSPGTHALAARLRERYGDAVRGVLFYGSCLRGGDDFNGVVDLYVLVDKYRDAYANPALALVNHLLPPNVFYLEAAVGERVVRAKYAVLSLRDLARGTSAGTFEPYFWARFAQPCALVYAADAQVRREVVTALADAILTMVTRGVPLVAPVFTSHELWMTTWRETYRTELRAERPEVIDALWANAPDRYVRATALALEALPYPTEATSAGESPTYTVHLPERTRRGARVLWDLRRVHGKTRFLLRLLRNALIFEGGVDYALWKIQRHSGIETASTWREQRHPLLALGAHARRLYRAGAFR